MPTYTYRCTRCGVEADAQRSIAARNVETYCHFCGKERDFALMERVIGKVNFARSTVKTDFHLSPVTGRPVRNHKDVERQLKEINDSTGSSLVLSDPTDPAAHGVTDEGLDATNRANTDINGTRDSQLWL